MARPSNQPLDPTLPNNADAERCVLGAILVENKYFDAAIDRIKASDFFNTANAKIFRAMVALHEQGSPIDYITITSVLEDQRELQNIPGGAGYVSSLTDDVPRISNVDHYAGIVHEKAVLRGAITGCEAIKKRAFEGLTKPGDLQFELDVMLKSLSNGHKKAEAIDALDLYTADLKPRDYVVSPVFPTQGIVMCHAWRGTGKTYIGIEIAHKIATGPRDVFSWQVPMRRKVLYVDGEMPKNSLQERYQKIVRGDVRFDTHAPNMGSFPERGYFRFLNRDDHSIPHIGTAEGQRFIESFLEDDMVLFLDNLTSLAPGGKESQEDWFPVQDWFLRLRHRGVHTWFFHHSGKSGTQRGASGREDCIDTSIQLRHPPDYNEADGLRAELHFEKLRNYLKGEGVWPFEISMQTDEETGGVTLMSRQLRELTQQRAFEMFTAGMNPRDVQEDLKLSRFQSYRLHKKWKIERPANN